MRSSFIQRLLLPCWHVDQTPDSQHPHRRRYTNAYQKKKAMVKNLWIGSGLLMILMGSAGIIAAIALAATFLSFTILDETE